MSKRFSYYLLLFGAEPRLRCPSTSGLCVVQSRMLLSTLQRLLLDIHSFPHWVLYTLQLPTLKGGLPLRGTSRELIRRAPFVFFGGMKCREKTSEYLVGVTLSDMYGRKRGGVKLHQQYYVVHFCVCCLFGCFLFGFT